ncbi:thioesterase II family protein [Micromonospora sp. CPCC 206061]|uniref:thioesterase II family protein n=1 Tax=Micromonospora sp. CPCC 206061 TaxID=3122410 RepID=UPI002FF42379
MTEDAGRWLIRFRPRPDAALRLVCFPHAGGSAAFFRPWLELVPPEVELVAVQYPGRLDRLGEPCVTDMDQMSRRILAALAATPGAAVALFGHSMGSVIAYEVARRLCAAPGGPPLARLMVSGRPGPAYHSGRTWHRAGDGALADELRRLGGTDEPALAHPELRGLVLSVLRNDYRLVETYRHRPGPPLSCPVTVLGGDDDPEAPVADLGGWAATTTGPVATRLFPGGHFYLVPHRPAVVREVMDSIGIRQGGTR